MEKRGHKDHKEHKDYKEHKEPKENKEPKETKESKEVVKENGLPMVPLEPVAEHEETSGPLMSARSKRPIKTALHQAVVDLRIHQVRLLVEKHGANVDSKDIYGRTPLMLACLLENADYGMKMMKIFQRAGAKINIKDNMRRTVLHYACMKGRLEMVQRLTHDDIIAINDKDNDGNTPLMLAALGGNPQIVEHIAELVLQFGLAVDERNKLGYTALMLACKYAHYASGYILLRKAGASPNLRDNEFFLTAGEWVHKSGVLHAAYPGPPHRSHTAPPLSRFDREYSLYMARFTPQCCHVKTAAHPLGQSLDSALHLPALFSRITINKPLEAFYKGKDARNLLLKAMDDAQVKVIPKTARSLATKKAAQGSQLSTRTSAWTQPTSAATRHLLAVAPRGRSCRMVPDMRTLFRLYSDQYEERRSKKPSISEPVPIHETRVQFSSPTVMPRKPGPTL
jgi:hypothetical protein